MTDYILNKIVLKNGDSLDIVESSTLPLPERLMYKMEHEKEKIIIRRGVGKMIIPVDNNGTFTSNDIGHIAFRLDSRFPHAQHRKR